MSATLPAVNPPVLADASTGAGRARDLVEVPGKTLDELVERVGPLAAGAVDALQVAASLEADGVTDEIARTEYGYTDVFVLAEEVHRRAGSVGLASAPTTAVPTTCQPAGPAPALRDVSHGLLYLLPATVFPAALAALGFRSVVLGLVLAAGVGWVWAGGATWLAYQLLGRGDAVSAARVLRWSAVAGLPVAAGASVVVTATTDAGYGLAAMAVALMAYQMAAALAMFYRREIWLFVAMAPAAMAGCAYLVAGERLLTLAVALGAGCIAVAFAIALWQTRSRGTGREPRLRDGMQGELAQLPVVVLYTALSATYLLLGQGRYMLDRFDIVVAYLPLILGMGIVEWRASRFSERSRALMNSVRYPREFVARVRLLLARDIAVCVAAVAGLAAVLVAALFIADLLSLPAAVMATASVLLAGAYFLGFLLANMGRFAWLCGSLAACIAVRLALIAAAPRGLSPVADTAVFLGSALLLFLLFLVELAGCVGQARHHR